ncbi:tRNA pseudouridine(38-40) synthase TruA [Candidatus Nucleicultrix amoebiphila]|jgi:tRNA pseudouridine38-40 synthase|uniref:tRNA pseudouridine(38-40) synthase TruA n=1 Tax=Candidatus Nucleicultrix amoebiphila TaxID=1509244 RepID=UPI001E564003|nr:tRNA pseudouridine(38-40) synthase TruA [Candidatus Nucleicultrix amoebiphila]
MINEPLVHRYKLTLEYDGTSFAGWQRQDNLLTVQEALETAFTKFCGCDIKVHGAGRTDAGVHATGQVAHVDLPKIYEPFVIGQALGFYLETLPISVIHVEPVALDFHARFSATSRTYRYLIINRYAPLVFQKKRVWHVHGQSLDAVKMHEAAQVLVGHHDFTSFRAQLCQAKSPEKTLDLLTVERKGELIEIHAKARSFLHHQVRNFVGTLKLVGAGKLSVDDVKNILAAKDRTKAGPTAPAEGLYLINVGYN